MYTECTLLYLFHTSISKKITFFWFSFFWLYHTACGILVPQLGIKPEPSVLKVWSLNHWTAGETTIKKKFFKLGLKSHAKSISPIQKYFLASTVEVQFSLEFRTQAPHFSLSIFQRTSLQSCPTPCDAMDGSLPGSSVHGILQARILAWVSMPASRGSSQSRD